jgi:glutamine amidotransferase
MIAIIDYGVGNINAFVNIYKKLGVEVKIARNAEDLNNASKLILPGVGHFDYAMERFSASGMREVCTELVINQKIPVLGICVGMQMLAARSDEGVLPGLSWIDATVRKFDPSTLSHSTRLPHMGWNNIKVKNNNPLLVNLDDDQVRFYFLHSYYFECRVVDNAIAVAEYGKSFTCVVNHDNIYGVQFHPEKSHRFGVQLLENFSNV